MIKKQMQQIVTASYKKGLLDETFVNNVLLHLTRKDQKKYINELKTFEQKNSVTVTTAYPLSEKDMEKIIALYPNKKINVEIDPLLILGVTIVDTDMVYSANLADTLDKMVTYISKV